MSKKYIKINSVEDIDLGTINLGNINNRYIDNSGNRFATRFNMRTRKIQIVRIALGEDEAINSRGKVIKGLHPKKERLEEPLAEEALKSDLQAPDLGAVGEPIPSEPPSDTQPDVYDQHPDLPKWVHGLPVEINENVEIGHFLVSLNEEIKLSSERLFGILSNMKNAGLLNRESGGGQDPMLKLTNIYDNEIDPSFKEAQLKLEEITKYPKDVHDYQTLIEHKYLRKLENLSTPDQWNFVKAYIVGHTYLNGLEATHRFLQQCSQVLEKVDEDALGASERQAMDDAMVSVSFVQDNTYSNIGNVLGWMVQAGIY